MNVLVLGGTRFFGVHMVNSLLSKGHNVTIATRGKTKDAFEDKVERIIILKDFIFMLNKLLKIIQ